MGIEVAILVAAIAATGVATVGVIQSGEAQAAQAKSQQAMANYNALLSKRQADAARAESQQAQLQQARAARRKESSLLARLGISGVAPSEGTPLLIQSVQAQESELENLLIGYEGIIGRNRALSQSALDQTQAGIFGSRAFAARTGSFCVTKSYPVGLSYSRGKG